MEKSSVREVKKLPSGGWIYYLSGEENCLDKHKCGKWMLFFNNKEFAAHICEEAVAQGICVESKHTDIRQLRLMMYIKKCWNRRRILRSMQNKS